MSTGDRRFRSVKRPFWLPASKFYFLSAAMAIGIFFLVWLILQEGHDETPWITAGLATSLFLIGAVVMREIVLRNFRNRMIAARQQLDRSLAFAPIVSRLRDSGEKLTVERNNAFIAEIRRKSDAAKVLSSVSGSHREVFELCAHYLDIVERELPNIGVGSPRLAALRRGRETASRSHRYHMLQWTELEIRANSRAETGLESLKERLEHVRKAYGVIDEAISWYPEDIRLVDSEMALREHLETLRVLAMVENAENIADLGDTKQALALFRDALGLAEALPETTDVRNSVISKVSEEIQGLERASLE